MPELPEVETVRTGLEPHLKGARIKGVTLRRKDLRFPLPKALERKIKGARFAGIDRRAKYLLFRLSNGLTLLSHLGMTGRFRIEGKVRAHRPDALYYDTPEAVRHDHLIIELEGGRRLTYNDARRFGFVELLDASELAGRFAKIGIEPLAKEFNGTKLQKLLSGKKAPIKAALLDQTLIAGIGNIYASEALYLAKISPKKAAGRLKLDQYNALAKAIRQVLKKAIRYGGSTLRDFRNAGGEAGRFQHEFEVYDKKGEPCPRCWSAIASLTQAGRTTFYCPRCQR